jgi:hypothetical protein
MHLAVNRHLRHTRDPRDLADGEETSFQQRVITHRHDTSPLRIGPITGKKARVTPAVNGTWDSRQSHQLADVRQPRNTLARLLPDRPVPAVLEP